jgi:hypothetical protein
VLDQNAAVNVGLRETLGHADRPERHWPARQRRIDMGLMSKLKGLTKGRKGQVKEGIDKGADVIDDKLPAHADKVEKVADVAKSAVDKLPE